MACQSGAAVRGIFRPSTADGLPAVSPMRAPAARHGSRPRPGAPSLGGQCRPTAPAQTRRSPAVCAAAPPRGFPAPVRREQHVESLAAGQSGRWAARPNWASSLLSRRTPPAEKARVAGTPGVGSGVDRAHMPAGFFVRLEHGPSKNLATGLPVTRTFFLRRSPIGPQPGRLSSIPAHPVTLRVGQTIHSTSMVMATSPPRTPRRPAPPSQFRPTYSGPHLRGGCADGTATTSDPVIW